MMRTVLLLLASSTWLAAQGSLDPPPGGPAPSLKTLQQVEPRVDVFSAPPSAVDTADDRFWVVIKRPGSYYLSANLVVGAGSINGGPIRTSGIRIDASGVTLDLNGFSIYGIGGALGGNDTGNAIEIALGVSDVTVENGSIRGRSTVEYSEISLPRWTTVEAGFSFGIAAGLNVRGCRFRNLRVSGCRFMGIRAGEAATVDSCQLRENVFEGLSISSGTVRNTVVSHTYGDAITGSGVVLGCVANRNKGTGIRGTVVSESEARQNDVDGIVADTVSKCVAEQNSGAGIRADSAHHSTVTSNAGNGFEAGESVSGCAAYNNGGHGFQCGGGLVGCMAVSNDGDGFRLFDGSSATNCMASRNTVGFSGVGLTLTGCSARDHSGDGFVTAEGLLQGCRASANDGYGFVVNGGSLDHCLARENQLSGFGNSSQGTSYRNCTAAENLGYGFFATAAGSSLHGCRATGNTRSGISAGSHSLVKDCVAYDNDEIGVVTVEGTSLVGNNATRNGLDGFRGGTGCRIIDNLAHRNGRSGTGGGILLPSATAPTNALVRGNHVTQNDFGIRVQGEGNLVFRNNVSDNGSQDFDINLLRNDVGKIVWGKQSVFNGFDGIPAWDPYVNIRITPPDTVNDP